MRQVSPRQERERRRRQEMRLSILKAAESIIITKGYSAMTMDDVARRAQLSKATVYRYFSSKGMILFEIIEQYFFEICETIKEILAKKIKATEKLNQAIHLIIRFHLEKENISRILMMDKYMLKIMRLIFEGNVHYSSSPEQKRLLRLKQKSVEVIKTAARIIDEGISSGEFRRVDAEETIAFISALLEGLFHNQLWREKFRKEDELSEKVFGFVFSGIKKPLIEG